MLMTIDTEGPPSKDLTFLILQPLMFGLEPTEELVHLGLPVIKKGIEVYKGMLGRDSAVKCFEVLSMVIDSLFKYDEKKKSLDTNNVTFLFCITFLVLQGSGKKKCFCWLACMNVKKNVE